MLKEMQFWMKMKKWETKTDRILTLQYWQQSITNKIKTQKFSYSISLHSYMKGKKVEWARDRRENDKKGSQEKCKKMYLQKSLCKVQRLKYHFRQQRSCCTCNKIIFPVLLWHCLYSLTNRRLKLIILGGRRHEASCLSFPL